MILDIDVAKYGDPMNWRKMRRLIAQGLQKILTDFVSTRTNKRMKKTKYVPSKEDLEIQAFINKRVAEMRAQ